MQTTRKFELKMREKGREEIEREWCERVLKAPLEIVEQNDGSYRMWGFILEEGKYLRVIALPDRETVDNAFFDRNYKRRQR
jgi:hypothetical protein